MKSEDLIDRYIESNEWKNPYFETYDPLDEIEEPPPEDDPVSPDQYSKDRVAWIALRDRILQDPLGLKFLRKWSYADIQEDAVMYQGYYDVEGQDAYRFIRKVLEKITNPYGGYLYRRHHYLGYVGTMGILIPDGFSVAKEEHSRAQHGGYVTGFLKEVLKNLHTLGQEIGLTKPYAKLVVNNYRRSYIKGMQFIKKAWNERYTILYSNYVDYPNYAIDDLIKSAVSDLYLVRIRKKVTMNVVNLTSQKTIGPKTFPSVLNIIGDNDDWIKQIKTESNFSILNQTFPKTLFSCAFLISEMLLMFEYIKRFNSMIPYPVFPNFGFKGTLPNALVDANIGAVVDVLDSFFKTAGYGRAGGRGRDFGYQETDPVVSYINSSAGEEGGTPPPSGPRGGRGYQE